MGGVENDDADVDDYNLHPENNGKVSVAINIEATTYECFRSSVTHLYRESGVKITDSMIVNFSRYVKGSTRINLASK